MTFIEQQGRRGPNVVLIVADDLGYGDLGCYGSVVNHSPNIDRLAREGSVLTNFYMSSPVCSPSRAALMTGCYPQRVGLGTGETFDVLLPGDAIGLDPGETTLPRLFNQAGYRTGMVGKWHLGDQPRFLPDQHGFESYLGLPYSNDMHPPHRWRREEGYRFPKLPLIEGSVVIEEDPIQEDLTDRYTEYALDFINEHQSESFFLYFAHMYVHTPLRVPSRFLERSENGSYGAAVEHIDEAVGQIATRLDQLGLRSHTIIIVTSDNGSTGLLGGSNAPLRGAKFETWEGGVRVPCIVNWPGRSKIGAIAEVITAMDLLPTLASVCTVGEANNIDGIDLSGLLFDGDLNVGRRDVFYYYNADRLEAVRWKGWKLSLLSGELFDLEDDPTESTDISRGHPEIVRAILEMAESARLELGDRLTGQIGAACRPPGRVEHPTTLTALVPDHLIDSMYD